jgi:hypothetical protein
MRAYLQSKVLLILLFGVCVISPRPAHAAGDLQIVLARPTGGGLVSIGGDYRLAGAVGQADAGRVSSTPYRLNGGVIGELLQAGGGRQLFLPMIFRSYLLAATVHESEPNNYFSQANWLERLPVRVLGNHDGTAGTGDVYYLELQPGQVLNIELLTDDTNGVQLLAYDSGGGEIGRDFEDPFALTIYAQYDGIYYLYVYTPAEAANVAAYEMNAQLSGQVLQESAIAPAMEAGQWEQPPPIRP